MDVRYAARMARGSPGVTAAVVLSLGLAIGGNTAVFSAVQAVLLRPLPFRDPDRLVWVWEKNPRDDRPRHQVSWASFAAVRDESGVFEDIGASTARSTLLQAVITTIGSVASISQSRASRSSPSRPEVVSRA